MADQDDDQFRKSEEEWRAQLTPEQFAIARQGGTERAFTGKLYRNEGKGVYQCVCCRADLFRSNEKYDSGSGWPSFWQPASDGAIRYLEDLSLGMVRTEVQCARCDAHLGHVFDDGPQPSGKRFCINSASLEFEDD